jgi:hypothetical protein
VGHRIAFVLLVGDILEFSLPTTGLYYPSGLCYLSMAAKKIPYITNLKRERINFGSGFQFMVVLPHNFGPMARQSIM